MQQIMSQIRAAVDSYQLIQSGDRIAVGISGGKDSLVLLCALANMRKFLPTFVRWKNYAVGYK